MRLAAFIVLATVAPALATGAPPEPAGYRMDEYRAPTPATLAGATVLDTVAAERLWREGGSMFLDVLPRAERPGNLPPGTIWRDKRHETIPNGLWLANVGYGALSTQMETYFRRSLAEVTVGDLSRPLVFYCQAACWMSWNAAKRALAWGYTRVSWYPDGTDGWAAAGLPLVEAAPHRLPE